MFTTGVIVPSQLSVPVNTGAVTTGLHPARGPLTAVVVITGFCVSTFHVYVTVQVAVFPLYVADNTNAWLREQPFSITLPGIQVGVSVPPQPCVTVTKARASSQSGKVAGLHPRAIGEVGQPENTGVPSSVVQVKVTEQVDEFVQPSVAVSVKVCVC